MDRYTKRDKDGTAYIPGVPQTIGLKSIEKFAHYEDLEEQGELIKTEDLADAFIKIVKRLIDQCDAEFIVHFLKGKMGERIEEAATKRLAEWEDNKDA